MELKKFYSAFEIKDIAQFKDAIHTMAEYAERLPAEGKLELDRDEYQRLRETFWTAANNFDSFVVDKELADWGRRMKQKNQQEQAIRIVKENCRPTDTPNAGALFEYFSDVPEETAKTFVEKYYGPCTEQPAENCKLYVDANGVHVATFIGGRTLAFGGSRTSTELKEAFVW
ncbi:hypothetical protein AGMMS4952_11100 [Spirochaetia bacterium]|nr:hypothetical protein AGMMS4952_11100 [Spirochaetia bacterium]